MFLAEFIQYLVLALEVEHINGKNYMTEKRILLLAKMFLQTAVVVE